MYCNNYVQEAVDPRIRWRNVIRNTDPVKRQNFINQLENNYLQYEAALKQCKSYCRKDRSSDKCVVCATELAAASQHPLLRFL